MMKRVGANAGDGRFIPAPEVLPVDVVSRSGDADHGLKIISIHGDDSGLRLAVEGLAGQQYTLGLVNADLVAAVQGAELRDGVLVIDFPREKTTAFIRREIVIRKK